MNHAHPDCVGVWCIDDQTATVRCNRCGQRHAATDTAYEAWMAWADVQEQLEKLWTEMHHQPPEPWKPDEGTPLLGEEGQP